METRIDQAIATYAQLNDMSVEDAKKHIAANEDAQEIIMMMCFAA